MLAFFDGLTPPEREVMKSRLDAATGEILPLAEVAALHGISRQDVRDIESRSCRSARETWGISRG